MAIIIIIIIIIIIVIIIIVIIIINIIIIIITIIAFHSRMKRHGTLFFTITPLILRQLFCLHYFIEYPHMH